MAEQEFLASFGVEIDESGVERLQEALTRNRELAEELASAFDRARSAVQAFFREAEGLSLPGLDLGARRVTEEGSASLSMPFSLDLTKAGKDLASFVKEAGKPLQLSADASAVVSAGRGALSQLQALFASSVLPLQAVIETTVPGASGAGLSGALSGISQVLSAPSPAPNVSNSSSRTVQAPVSINVSAAGSSPESVARSVYDVTEQYLLRTLNSYG